MSQLVTGAGDGRRLDPSVRALMESRFGEDFADVRIHAGAGASTSAANLSAAAYTVGDDIILGRNLPSLYSLQGRYLLSHELAHVVQQRRGGQPPAPHDSLLEANAHDAASQLLNDSGSVTVGGGSAPGIACLPWGELGKRVAEKIDHTVDALPMDERTKAGIKAQARTVTDAAVTLAGPQNDVPKQIEAQIAVVDPSLTAAPAKAPVQPAAAPVKTPEPAKPVGPQPARGMAIDPLIWSNTFSTNFQQGIRDQDLKSSWDRLNADLDKHGGKADFAIGVTAGLAIGATEGALAPINAVTDIWKIRYPSLFNPDLASEADAPKNDKEFARYAVNGVAAFVKKLPDLAAVLAQHPDEYGYLLGQLAGGKLKSRLFGEGPEKKPTDLNPTDLLTDWAVELASKARVGGMDNKAREKGIAFGRFSGEVILNVAMLFVEPEEVAAKAMGVSKEAIVVIKNSRVGKEVHATLESIPEFKRVLDARKVAAAATGAAKRTAGVVEVGTKEGATVAADLKAPSAPVPGATTSEVSAAGTTPATVATGATKGTASGTAQAPGEVAKATRKPTINRFGKDEVDELVGHWQKKLDGTTDETLRKQYRQAIDFLQKRGRVGSWKQSEDEVRHLYSLIGGKGETAYLGGKIVDNPIGVKGVVKPDVVPPHVLGEVKNWEMTHFSDVKTAEKMMDKLADQIKQRSIHGPTDITKQTVILDLRGQALSEVQLQQIGETFSAKTGLPIENIQLIVWAK